MANTVRQRVPLKCSSMTESACTVCICVGLGDSESTIICRGTKLSAGNVRSEKLRHIGRRMTREEIEADSREFVFNACLNWKPMQCA